MLSTAERISASKTQAPYFFRIELDSLSMKPSLSTTRGARDVAVPFNELGDAVTNNPKDAARTGPVRNEPLLPENINRGANDLGRLSNVEPMLTSQNTLAFHRVKQHGPPHLSRRREDDAGLGLR